MSQVNCKLYSAACTGERVELPVVTVAQQQPRHAPADQQQPRQVVRGEGRLLEVHEAADGVQKDGAAL